MNLNSGAERQRRREQIRNRGNAAVQPDGEWMADMFSLTDNVVSVCFMTSGGRVSCLEIQRFRHI